MKLKRILSAVAAFALCASLAGCGASASSVAESTAESASTEAVSTMEEEASPETSAETTALRVAGLKGPTTMGLVNMLTADDAADLVDFNMYGAADEVVPQLVKGDIDAAAVPANLAATLYQKTNGAVEVACVNTLGVLYIVENGETVNSVADLKGQTLGHHRARAPRRSMSCAMSCPRTASTPTTMSPSSTAAKPPRL